MGNDVDIFLHLKRLFRILCMPSRIWNTDYIRSLIYYIIIWIVKVFNFEWMEKIFLWSMNSWQKYLNIHNKDIRRIQLVFSTSRNIFPNLSIMKKYVISFSNSQCIFLKFALNTESIFTLKLCITLMDTREFIMENEL